MHEDQEAPKRFPCPCCGYLTLKCRGQYDICAVCNWEDEYRCDEFPDEDSGANGGTLNEGRATFKRIGAYSPEALDRVRQPSPSEQPAPSARHV